MAVPSIIPAHPAAGSPLFRSLQPEEVSKLLACLQAAEKTYDKGEILLLAGDVAHHLGLVLSGSVNVRKEDIDGSAALLARIFPGELFAEAFAASGLPLAVTAEAAEKTAVLWLDYRRLLAPCRNACAFHSTAIGNLLEILARKNVFLTGRIEHLSKRSLKEKVLSYLSDQAARQGSRRVVIPFDRQGLADYLAADRSALSAVLGRLRDEGALSFRKNEFTLL